MNSEERSKDAILGKERRLSLPKWVGCSRRRWAGIDGINLGTFVGICSRDLGGIFLNPYLKSHLTGRFITFRLLAVVLRLSSVIDQHTAEPPHLRIYAGRSRI
jgi:hypothetical protein